MSPFPTWQHLINMGPDLLGSSEETIGKGFFREDGTEQSGLRRGHCVADTGARWWHRCHSRNSGWLLVPSCPKAVVRKASGLVLWMSASIFLMSFYTDYCCPVGYYRDIIILLSFSQGLWEDWSMMFLATCPLLSGSTCEQINMAAVAR